MALLLVLNKDLGTWEPVPGEAHEGLRPVLQNRLAEIEGQGAAWGNCVQVLLRWLLSAQGTDFGAAYALRGTFGKSLLNSGNDRLKLSLVDGLDEVIHHPQADRLLGVGEVAKTAVNDIGHLRSQRLSLEQKIDPVHLRHLNIRKHQVEIGSLQKLQSLFAVPGLLKMIAVAMGGEEVLQTLTLHPLIVHQ